MKRRSWLKLGLGSAVLLAVGGGLVASMEPGWRQVAERIRHAICDEPMNIGHQLHPMTTSLGTALALPGESQADLLERADAALYQAKSQGRNRTLHATDNL